jgi:hypothetical protein
VRVRVSTLRVAGSPQKADAGAGRVRVLAKSLRGGCGSNLKPAAGPGGRVGLDFILSNPNNPNNPKMLSFLGTSSSNDCLNW